MKLGNLPIFVVALCLAASCGGGGPGDGGTFRLIEFLESGQNQIPRNRELTFVFSAPVATNQDFFERLKIQNIQTGANSNFSLALGMYVVDAERVHFSPLLPNEEDRSDAGFREKGKYTVFLKGGPDALVSEAGDPIARPQEFTFDTNEFFEDEFPTSPPRVRGFFARDVTLLPTAPRVDLSRLDPRPNELALFDNADLITSARVLEPGAGANYGTPWRFELEISEPLDPATVTPDSVEMFEVFSDATTSGEAAPPFAPPDYWGSPAGFKVPVNVGVDQQTLDAQGNHVVCITVTPLFTLVDNTRYRIQFSGDILGLDFRQQFIGVNGLTGDGETILPGETQPFPEPGGLGYTTDFIVRDRPAITSRRTLTYDPLLDNVRPETGQTTTDPTRYNSALYNPAGSPGTAVGYLSAFGNGSDGDLAVSNGTVTIDTGDTPNPPLGKPFVVTDLNPNDNYTANTLPGGPVTYDSNSPFELNLESLSISSGATLQFVGVNPVLLRIRGVVQITGTLDVSGANGENAALRTVNGGAGGPGGGQGGFSKRGDLCNNLQYNVCPSFTAFLAACNNSMPYSVNGEGPGRGHAGGSGGGYPYTSPPQYYPTSGTGGGGGSHATVGTAGQDRTSEGSQPGTGGKCMPSQYYGIQNSSVVGVRGMPGSIYPDPEVDDVLWGGSGGGAGGGSTDYSGFSLNISGGAGGGGGGTVSIIAAGSILISGGQIDASGGDGGAGAKATYSTSYNTLTGGGGGGSGGSVCLISGEGVVTTGGILDTTGGAGGAPPPSPSGNCLNCNGGGSGGKGYIFLMDPDGIIPGLLPGSTGTYPTFATGYLTIAEFASAGDRFGEIRAVTELFNVLAANPAYEDFNQDRDGDGNPDSDILALVSTGQEIEIYATTAKANAANPLKPDVSTEMGVSLLVARVRYELGAATVDVFDNMDQLNPTGPARDAFLRVDALFIYGDPVEAALGPFAYMDRVDVWYSFN